MLGSALPLALPHLDGDLLGDVWVVDFIYARCGAICADMSRVFIELQEQELPARFLSITAGADASRDARQG